MSVPTALIAEDEPLLAAALEAELARAWPELQIVANVRDGASAVREALALRPDVLLLDIQMPGQSGLDAAAELTDAWDPANAPFPALVFVTAYDQYAVQAFEAEALDYLLKPVEPTRLLKTVQKLHLHLATRPRPVAESSTGESAALQATADHLRQLLITLQSGTARAQPPLRQIPVSLAGSGGNAIHLVPVADVLFFQATDKYVRVATEHAEYLLRTPLKELLPQLDDRQFWQIHRSTVVRADAIDVVQRDATGHLNLRLRGHPEPLRVSRLFAHHFKAM